MNLKKILLLASMALAALAFALPAGAMAEDKITDNGEVTNDQLIKFEGPFKFESLGTGLTCKKTTAVVTVNGGTVRVTEFNVLEPTTQCEFFGSIYGNCAFEQHSTALQNGPLPIDLVTSGTTLQATITGGTNAGVHGLIGYELTSVPGKTCTVTTHDLTIVHETGVGISADIETTGGFISGIELTGSLRVDRGAPAAGTTTPHSVNVSVGVGDTLKIEASQANTYTYSGT